MDMQTVIEELRRRGRNMVALDTPQDSDLADFGADLAMGFTPVLGQIQALRDIERSRRENDPAGMAMGVASFIPFGKLLASALRKSNPAMRELDVYHGTPHRFEPTEANPLGEFDASKIGTGEGAQAYGHGTYLAEAEGTGRGYAKNLANRDVMNQNRLNAHANAQRLATLAGDAKYAADDIRFVLETDPQNNQSQLLKDTLQFLESGEYAKPLANPGYLYKADLPDEMIDRMLDWDKPINEQNPIVLEMLEKAGINTMSTAQAGPMARGQEAHLARFGIPGIKYFDEGSRNTAGKWIARHPRGGETAFNTEKEMREFIKRNPEMSAIAPNQTRNFVVFPGEEKKVRILEKK